jgi:carboxylesterase
MIINPHLAGDTFFWPGTGPQAQTGLLLSHGFAATTAEVRPLAQLLQQAGYTISGPLLPGHKTTPDDLNTCRWQDWLNTFEQAYQQLRNQCNRIFVGGESLGGVLALRLAQAHPEVTGVLAYAPALQMRWTRRIGVRLLAPFVKHFNTAGKRQTVVDDVWQGYSVRPAKGVLQLYALADQVKRQLSTTRQPMFVVQGRLDATIDPAGAQMLYDRSGATYKELHWMDQSTHCVILDHELPQVASLTLKFIAKVSEAETV